MKKFIYTIAVLFSIALFSQSNNLIAQETMNKQSVVELSVFPNPALANQELNIKINVQENDIIKYFIFDFTGKIVQESIDIQPSFGEDQITVKTRIAEKGMYFIKVILSNKNTSYKISKVKKFHVN